MVLCLSDILYIVYIIAFNSVGFPWPLLHCFLLWFGISIHLFLPQSTEVQITLCGRASVWQDACVLLDTWICVFISDYFFLRMVYHGMKITMNFTTIWENMFGSLFQGFFFAKPR